MNVVLIGKHKSPARSVSRNDLPDLPLQRPAQLRPERSSPPCPDCGGTMVAHCCDGLTACNDPIDEALEAQVVIQ